MTIEGKTALVTGGAKRIGRTIALALAKHGCNVAVHFRSSEVEAHKTVRDILDCDVRSMVVQADVSKKKEVHTMARSIQKKLGPVDILINNASVFKRKSFFDLTEDDWDEHMNVNLKGAFFCAQALSPSMVKRKQGKIINIVDWCAKRPFPNYLPYTISKAGLVSLTKALAKELAPHVHVNGIGPGAILFPPDASEQRKVAVLSKIPLGRTGSPQDVANTVLFLLQGADYMTGNIIYVDGGRLLA